MSDVPNLDALAMGVYKILFGAPSTAIDMENLSVLRVFAAKVALKYANLAYEATSGNEDAPAILEEFRNIRQLAAEEARGDE